MLRRRYLILFLEIVKINFVYSAIINLRHFGIIGLLKMPIIIQYGSTFRCKSKSGIAFLKPLKLNMLTIKGGCDIQVEEGGRVLLTGVRALFSRKNKVYVSYKGTFEIGNNFWVNNDAEFQCRKSLKFGDDVLVSCHVLFLDSDHHPIFNEENEILNPDRGIVMGNKVWIGCRVTILKGAHIGNNIVVGAGSLVTGNLLEENSIYCGNPLRCVKKGVSWSLSHPDF